jgi:hypothetical protein
LGLTAAALIGAAHAPYIQWTIYRRRNLFIVASRTDAAAIALAERLAEVLARELPTSHARYTRATDPVRVASLIATDQIEVAVVSRGEAAEMIAGKGPFAAVGPVPVRLLFDLGAHVLIALATFKQTHAYLLAHTLDHARGRLQIEAGAIGAPQVPDHPGALAYRQGLEMPKDAQADGGGG